jgi:hypothetical protein
MVKGSNKRKGRFGMAKFWTGVASVVLFFVFYAWVNSAGCQMVRKHMVSSMVGLERHISLYDASGKIIKEWDVKSKVEDQGGTCYFLDDKGKAVTVSGFFIIQEK